MQRGELALADTLEGLEANNGREKEHGEAPEVTAHQSTCARKVSEKQKEAKKAKKRSRTAARDRNGQKRYLYSRYHLREVGGRPMRRDQGSEEKQEKISAPAL